MSQAEIQEMKKQLHEKIDAIEDETALQMLNEAATEYTALGQRDVLDELTPEQLDGLKEAIKQADEGDVVPHSEAKKIFAQWRTR